MPDILGSPEIQPEQIKAKLRSGEIKPDEIDKIVATLDKPEVLEAIRGTIDTSFAESILKNLNQKATLTDADRAIMNLIYRLHPLSIEARIATTNAPSGKVIAVLNGGGGALNFEQLKTLPKEKLEELFRGVNKGDLMAIARSVPDTKPENLDQKTFDALKSVLSATVTSMVQNGMTLGSPEDIVFLEKYGSTEIQAKIKKEREPGGALHNFTGKPNIIVRGGGSTLEFVQIMDSKTGNISKGLDISKLNTIDMKKSAEALRAQLPKMDMKGLEDMVGNLLKSDNSILRGLGELFRIFGGFLGLKFDKGEKTPEATNKLSNKQKRALLENMGDPKKTEYDISTFFDAQGNPTGKPDDQKFQSYLKDIHALIGKEIPKDGKPLEYNEDLSKAIRAYEGSIDGKPTGKLDKARIEELLKSLDANGEIIKKTETAPEVKKEKHEYGDLFKTLEGKSYVQIKSLLRQSSQKLSKPQVEAIQTELGFSRGNTDKSKRIDGDIGPGTVKAFLEKYKDGIKDVAPVAQKK